jgi:molybdopterin/thiamine biosynthesis adenylyltransferase
LASPVFQNRSPLPLRGAVLEVTDSTGRVLARLDERVSQTYQQRITGFWYRAASLPLINDPEMAIAALTAQHASLSHQWITTNGDKISIVGVVFPEELGWNERGDGWLFVVRAQAKHLRQHVSYFARTTRAGAQDLGQRIPELSPFRTQTIGVVGLGCVGGPSALHFARAGVRDLRVLDYDIVDAGNSVRWPLGFLASGLRKTDAMHEFVARNYPYTTVTGFNHRIGDVDADERTIFSSFFDSLDLLYDASAEFGVNHLLSDLARSRSLPYITITTTPGGWGGKIIRVRPNVTTGCWMCAMHHLDSGSIPTPPAAPTGVQPVGCANPTFTGAGFDVEEIALMGVRLAASTICPEYAKATWDIALIRLRDDQGTSLTPEWSTFALDRHLSCRNHDASLLV